MMPSEYTAQISLDDAREMAKIHGVKYSEIMITPVFEAFTYACCAQLPVPARTKTYAAPAWGTAVFVASPSIPTALLDSPSDPTTTVSFDTATDPPNAAYVRVFDALR